MTESFDVVVVGARCAGAPLGLLLARAGLKVCLLDRSRFPSEVPSTHTIQPNGVAALDRLGLLEQVRSTGAPAVVQAKVDINGVVIDYSEGFVERTGWPMYCVRRSSMDHLLGSAAASAGADFRPATAVTGLVRDRGRVVGVETASGPIRASLVVGADGPHSAVARFAGAREYHVTPPGRLFMWGYFEGLDDVPPRIWLAKSEDIAMLAAPTDGDLFLVAIVPSMGDKDRYLADKSASLRDGLSHFPEVAEMVGSAGLAGPVRTMTRWHGYFRESAGPGWVLVGDAGHFKDPTPGQGIADAFRQVECLAPAIADGLASADLDHRLADWAAWRDADAWDMYWFATDIGAPGPTSPLVRETIRRIVERPGGADRFLRVLDHDLSPAELFTPSAAIGAALSLLARGGGNGRSVATEFAGLVRGTVARRRMRRRPQYDPGPVEPADRHHVASSAAVG